MTNKGNWAAFPYDDRGPGGTGMSYRDWLIGQALAGLSSGYYGQVALDHNVTPAHLGDTAVRIADATLEAMEKARQRKEA